jgi:hypothetical protein
VMQRLPTSTPGTSFASPEMEPCRVALHAPTIEGGANELNGYVCHGVYTGPVPACVMPHARDASRRAGGPERYRVTAVTPRRTRPGFKWEPETVP